MTRAFVPHIVGIGGTLRAGSSSELVVRAALCEAQKLGATTEAIVGPDLVMPMYSPEAAARTPQAIRLLTALRRAHGVIVASPAYHGSLSGLLKNALDYTEDMRTDERTYLSGRAVGCIACAGGVQAGASTLATLRSIVHALRGWPTPLGVMLNTSMPLFDADGACVDASSAGQLGILAKEVVMFANASCGAAASGDTAAADKRVLDAVPAT
ncbi:NADPH-dependent FMN reductase [Paraburkholderia caballeronis]|uniref:FMN reductase n=1 Tax=Paraburkholderia caballeronis TaxID=416943 RepID=A0A1H7LYR4_9BURK|nr:NAD(P)H-dependent oxidoreductase [Paraburkholderia caballeronis]PXW28654.1 NAD(P)H-dependent FMN reductase [Paraburkholderia caballeronis]PXX04020.1 NAD(P)H-dependent FMN reductase [Paraburkholderia caballeronis]RAK04764.1 NAD(P)H-dependent FMN reductase [Paraburkholderia caballeronis]TDV19665.1 NAD(P)H-dependent FMN reductase [Paraburkholderia caballeronis]TDV22264.1 NAD(P)H-dependent FMN reductase [Paraburkholderia caballeronis]